MSDDLRKLAEREMSVPEPAPEEGEAVVVEWLFAHLYDLQAGSGRSQRIADALRLAEERDTFGRDKYGTPLMSHNGRDCIEDARQEMGDLMMYLAQAHMEGRDVGELKRLHRVVGELLEYREGKSDE